MPFASRNGPEPANEPRDEIVNVVPFDEIATVLDGHFDEEHAGECSHGVHVGRHADEANSNIWIGNNEVDNCDRCSDGIGGTIEKIMRNWVVARQPSEDM